MELSFRSLIEKAKQGDYYWSSKLSMSFAMDIHRLMQQRGLSNVDLAQRIGVSQAYISKVLRGDANFTVQTMAKLASAVGARIHIQVADHQQDILWIGKVRADNQKKADYLKHHFVAMSEQGASDGPTTTAAA